MSFFQPLFLHNIIYPTSDCILSIFQWWVTSMHMCKPGRHTISRPFTGGTLTLDIRTLFHHHLLYHSGISSMQVYSFYHMQCATFEVPIVIPLTWSSLLHFHLCIIQTFIYTESIIGYFICHDSMTSL